MLGIVCLRTPRLRMFWQTMQTDGQIVAISQTDRQSGGAYVNRPDIPKIHVCLSDEHPDGDCMTFSATLGPKTEQNPYVASVAVISTGLSRLVPLPRDRTIYVLSRDQGALRAINKLNHQSGQATIKPIYKDTGTLRKARNCIRLEWIPTDRDWDLGQELGQKAKAASREATGENRVPRAGGVGATTTMFNTHKQRHERRRLHTSTGQHLQRIDTDLTGPHVRHIYDSLKLRQANTLVQLRTGMARLNGYLHQIGAIETGKCICGQTTETVEHFLLHCTEGKRNGKNCFSGQESERICFAIF